MGRPTAGGRLFALLALLVLMGTANNILTKALYNAYGERYSFFANQGSTFGYIALAGIAVAWRAGGATDVRPRAALPWRELTIMGTLDALTAFLASCGAGNQTL